MLSSMDIRLETAIASMQKLFEDKIKYASNTYNKELTNLKEEIGQIKKVMREVSGNEEDF